MAHCKKFKPNTAHTNFRAFAPGLTLVAGRPFSEKVQHKLVNYQRRLDPFLSKCSHPVFWYDPRWLHLSICAIMRSVYNGRSFTRLKLSDLTGSSRKCKLDRTLGKSLSGCPGVLIEAINDRLGDWHEAELTKKDGIKAPNIVTFEWEPPKVIHTGDIVVNVVSPSLSRLQTAMKEPLRIGKRTNGLHVTLGFLIPVKQNTRPKMDQKWLNGEIANNIGSNCDGTHELTGFLLAHYQSRTLATLYGSVRFQLDGTILDGGNFDTLCIER